jgi:hypothetical protein
MLLIFPCRQARIRDEDPKARATVVSAIRYTFSDSDTSYDELLSPVIVDFLALMVDSDLVRLTFPPEAEVLMVFISRPSDG